MREAMRPTGFRWQVVLIAILISLWEGFPHVLWGAPDSLGNQIWSMMSIIGVVIFLIRLPMRKVRLDRFQAASLVLIAWCYFVSFYFSTFIEPKPVNQWLQSGFVVMSTLSIFGLQAINTKVSDVEQAIVATGFLASLFAIIDTSLGLGMLSAFLRGSAFEGTKLVFFKLPSLFALVLSISKLFTSRSIGASIWWVTVAVATGYNVAVLTESRLATAGLAISAIVMAIFVFKGSRRVYIWVFIALVGFPASTYISSRYFSKFTNLSDYLANDSSASFRNLEIDHFSKIFAYTDGMGFGFMSLDRAYDNVLTFAAYKAGYLVHTWDYGMVVTDIGLYSALYQFGYVGLILVLGYTLWAGLTLFHARRLGPRYYGAASVGILFISLLVSPISINYFTVQWAAHIGALVFFMASQIRREASL